jgi:hypothetical protein
MTAPCIEACHFGVDHDGRWSRLARVLAYSAAQQCPGWTVTVAHATPRVRRCASGGIGHARNTEKMDEWRRIVMAAPDGARMLLIDVDTFIVRPLDDVWERPFDIAYTTKPAEFPFNAGVVFLRVSPRVRAFVHDWWTVNEKFARDREAHDTWRRRFGGINQAALGAILHAPEFATMRAGVHLETLPCREWNCEDSSWAFFDAERTRVVHVKSALRRAIFDSPSNQAGLRKLAALWRETEKASMVMPITMPGAPGNPHAERVRTGATHG